MKNIFPIFLLGSGRSGTTLLMKILNSMDHVILSGEHGGFLKQIADAYFFHFTDEKMKKRFEKEEAPDALFAKKLEYKPGYSWLHWYGKDTVKKNYKKFIESFFSPEKFSKKVCWGFKEIRYGINDQVMEMLIDLYPNARFVFIIRDPIDVIASQLVMGKWGDLDEIIRNWVSQNNHMLKFYYKNNENCFLIRYEEMISKDSDKLSQLFNWLGFEISAKQYNVLDIKEGIWKKSRKDGKSHRTIFNKWQTRKILSKTKIWNNVQ